MKNLKTITNNFIIATGIVMGLVIISTTFVHANPMDNKNKENTSNSQATQVESELAASWESDDEVLVDLNLPSTATVKIYNQNDELIYESFSAADELDEDKTLVKLMLQSDLLMNNGNTSYYRLSQQAQF